MTEEQQQQQVEQQPTQENKQKEVKFTQDDLNKFAAKVRAEEKAKAEKELTDYKAQVEKETERAKMTEQERIKAEKEEVEQRLQELQNQVDFNTRKNDALKGLTEAKLDTRLIDVLMSGKTDEEKIKLMADIQKDMTDKAIKEAMPTHKAELTNGLIKQKEDTKIKYNFEKFK